MNVENLINEALCAPPSALAYSVNRDLATLFPEKGLLEVTECGFDLESYAAHGHCTLSARRSVHSQTVAGWMGPGQPLYKRAENAWLEIDWQSHSLEVLVLSWTDGMHPTRRAWIMADTLALAESFVLTVCEWCAEVRGEVLVYEDGRWYKSEDLFQAIQDATFDNLILRGSLKDEIREDLAQFFASRETYERYRVPWKRGILFIGPPGNGKTHTVKALVNDIGRPCLYVKSFKAEYQTDHESIREVFQRARQTTPCLLVLEDLDALIDGQNRSFFLNELDGFAANTGIVTLATSNHPERLDPAILERPSRFDRKYHFDLPGPAERLAYLGLWNTGVEPALRLTEAGLEQITELTEEFSFAYLKELFLSSMMRWIAAPAPGGMESVMAAQVGALREQMSSGPEESADAFVDEEGEALQRSMRAMMQRRMAALRRGHLPR